MTSRETVEDYRFLYRYLLLVRNNALGNFQTFLALITKDPAMLRYLNGDQNVVGSPNENYGREIQSYLRWEPSTSTATPIIPKTT